MNWKSAASHYWASFSYVGLVTATLFSAASLSPSLVPRNYLFQGLLAGLAAAVGYGLGVAVVWVWRYLEIPEPRDKVQTIAKRITVAWVLCITVYFLWRTTVWQNSIRELMNMPPENSSYPVRVALIAVLFAAAIVALARLLGLGCRWCSGLLNKLLPRRISNVLGVVVVGLLFVAIVDGVLARAALTLADGVFLRMDRATDDGIEQPTHPLATGSAESLVDWESIGRQGKTFIAGGPTQEELTQFWQQPALRPLRVYVGVRTDGTLAERARLALDELIRVGGFERKVLVVATPTGTGWFDPAGVDTLEYLHAGDTAIVGLQYSYLPSWVTLLVDPNRSREAAQLLFNEVYAHWKQLPPETRPKLYLHGLSLGSLGSESSADLLEIFEDPIQGAVWSGPPFPSRVWSNVTRHRNPGSPAWLPKFRDGRTVRFTNNQHALDDLEGDWGPIRIVYLQHASDPMIFFSPDLLFQRPAWLTGERGPDVSPYLEWYPIITFLQVGFDLPLATSVPLGYGHNYAPKGYIHAWREVTDVKDWDASDTERLVKELEQRSR